MIVASQLRKTNIAEYLLYMWQVEDTIRAFNFDIDKIRQHLVFPDSLDNKEQIYEWYESLIDMMLREDIKVSGHLQMNKNILGALADLHKRVLADPSNKFDRYRKEFYTTLPFIVELRAKSGNADYGEIETCFTALYGMLLMHLAKKEPAPETKKAFDQISRFVALLADYFHRDERDELFKKEDKE